MIQIVEKSTRFKTGDLCGTLEIIVYRDQLINQTPQLDFGDNGL